MSKLNSTQIKLISIVVPLFNEAKRISMSLPVIEAELNSIEKVYKINCELILVDDGSTDDTKEAIDSILKFKNTKFISYPDNAGKGYALKKGFEATSGDYIFFMDADLSTPIKYIGTFIDIANKDIIIGSRKIDPNLIKKSQSLIRRKLGRGFTLLTNLVLGTSVTDFTCGFKMFPNKIGKKIFSNLTINRWGFDAEIVFLAKYYGCAIREIPVEWSNDRETKVRLSKDVIGSLIDIINIKIRSLKGLYDNK